MRLCLPIRAVAARLWNGCSQRSIQSRWRACPGPYWRSLATTVIRRHGSVWTNSSRPGSSTWSRCWQDARSEEHTSELQSLMRISYAVFCLQKKKDTTQTTQLDEQTEH